MPLADNSLHLVRALADLVRRHGGRAIVVGGFVRDRLLGRACKDIDVEVFGIDEAVLPALLAPLGRVTPVGQAFPVYKLETIDVALPRRESKVGVGHKGFEVRGDPAMTFEAAARRRDFTINAIGWDLIDDRYLDPFHGREDLDRRVLRVVDPATFADDSLRALRAIQFAARFELAAEPVTRDLCRAMRVHDLPAERLWGEVEKLLLVAERPSIGFALARDLGLISQVLPEMEPLFSCPQDPEWHPEGDVWTHTLMVIDEARRRNGDLDRPALTTVMLGATGHDLGKPATTAVIDGRIRSPGHEAAGLPPMTQLLDRFNIHRVDGIDVRQQVLGLVGHHLKPSAFFHDRDRITDGAFRRLAQKVDLELLARVARADCHGRGNAFDCSALDWFLQRARAIGVEHRPPAPILLGRHLLALGLSPGPDIGRLLKAVYELQLDGEVRSLDEAREAAGQLMPTNHSEPASS